jgi:hypothetical protein
MNFVVVMCLWLFPSIVLAQGFLENPTPNSSQSGQGIISGWHCSANRIDVVIDNSIRADAASGTPRGDTRDVCGDTNNGFGLPINWNLLGDGSHLVQVFADGALLGQAAISVTTFGTDFLTGKAGTWVIPQFPFSNTDTLISWQESLQGLTITGTRPHSTGGGGNFTGSWSGRAFSAIEVALSDVECFDADIGVTVNGSALSGAVHSDAGVTASLSGQVSVDGVLGGQISRNGGFFGVFSGQGGGSTLTGQWTDVFGCWRTFQMQKN